MRFVTFSKNRHPHRVGEQRVVTEDVAATLEGEGVISASEPWPPAGSLASQPDSPAAKKPARAVLQPKRPFARADQRQVR